MTIIFLKYCVTDPIPDATTSTMDSCETLSDLNGMVNRTATLRTASGDVIEEYMNPEFSMICTSISGSCVSTMTLAVGSFDPSTFQYTSTNGSLSASPAPAICQCTNSVVVTTDGGDVVIAGPTSTHVFGPTTYTDAGPANADPPIAGSTTTVSLSVTNPDYDPTITFGSDGYTVDMHFGWTAESLVPMTINNSDPSAVVYEASVTMPETVPIGGTVPYYTVFGKDTTFEEQQTHAVAIRCSNPKCCMFQLSPDQDFIRCVHCKRQGVNTCYCSESCAQFHYANGHHH
ncbi:hypothetical protein KIPB_003328 [Kipferlia bialata]|uniref:Uncharacterized protein n=1 Tax=Kipferlia bialata TaxID=797122 RepID=A0A9K3GFP0_9EUKA|nr:hypothetical protein KIPB_003328 [Kipferlia bialata]|eukprot:g3328.t1